MTTKPFLLCIDRFDRPDGMVWGVKVGRKWHFARKVFTMVPTHTVFKGPTARQPKAYVTGYGRVTRLKHAPGVLRIDP